MVEAFSQQGGGSPRIMRGTAPQTNSVIATEMAVITLYPL